MTIIQSFLAEVGLASEPTYFDVAKDVGQAILKPITVSYAVIKIGVQGATRENIKNLGMTVLGGYEGISMIAIKTACPWLNLSSLSRKVTAATVVIGVTLCSVEGFCAGLKLSKQHLGLKIAVLVCLAMCIVIAVKRIIRFF